jgi:DNA replication protein DnaC
VALILQTAAESSRSCRPGPYRQGQAWRIVAWSRPWNLLSRVSFDTFDFTAIPSLNKPLTLELARCEYLIARDNVIALVNSGTGKTHVCLALGLAACQRGFPVSFFMAAGLVHQLMEAHDERRLLKLQAQLAAVKLLIVDELGYVPLSHTGAELLFEIFSQRHERGSTIVTSNLPFEEMDERLGNQRLTGALLDRLTHHAIFWS